MTGPFLRFRVSSNPGHPGHFDIQQNNIYLLFLKQIVSLQRISTFAGDLYILYPAGYLAKGISCYFIIINDQDVHYSNIMN